MAISGKSSSVAAMLLMVAVLAGAANAQVNVSNLCNQTVVLTTGVANLTIPPATTIPSNDTAQNLLQGPVNVAILGLPVPTTIPIVPDLISTLLNALPIGGPIVAITIECSPSNCIIITATKNISIFGLASVPVSSSVGPICPALPPLPSVPLPSVP